MDRRVFCCLTFKGIIPVLLGASSLKTQPSDPVFPSYPIPIIQNKDPYEFLREIYDEVQELGRHGDDNFIKREFHVNLDGIDSNKEEHVVVLNHFSSGQAIMLLQVTYFESGRNNNPVKYAKMIRQIECCVLDKSIEIRRCDYDQTEIKSLLPNILRGIRETKKHLYLIR